MKPLGVLWYMVMFTTAGHNRGVIAVVIVYSHDRTLGHGRGHTV